jgi:hypothetical protein
VSSLRFGHYKGGIYELVCEAKLEADPSITAIVYRSADGAIWTPPASVFFETVEHDEVTVPRFTAID